MGNQITIVNTHAGENPIFTDELTRFLAALGIEPHVMGGYEGSRPLSSYANRVILTGVPLDVSYSLESTETQQRIDRAFGWLRHYPGPILGICFGHEILAHIFGGKVSSLERPVQNPQCRLSFSPDFDRGVFSGIEECEVFAEHLQYVHTVPGVFKVLSQKDGIPYVIYHSERQMYGVQFVPERSDSKCKDALRRFVTE